MQAHYGATKAVVLSMIQSMAVALAPHKIGCNAILPGTIRTQLSGLDKQSQEKRDSLEKRILLGVGKPQDLAGPAVFLGCSELSGYMTGAQWTAACLCTCSRGCHSGYPICPLRS